MSDLCDDLYSEDILVDLQKNQNHTQNEAENNEQIQLHGKDQTKNTKRVVKIKIKIRDTETRQNEEENANNCNVEQQIDCFEAKTLDTTYLIELLAIPAHTSYKVDNDSLSGSNKKNCEHFLESENCNDMAIDNNEKSSTIEHKREKKEIGTRQTLTKSLTNQVNMENLPTIQVQENKHNVYEQFNKKNCDDITNYIKKYMYNEDNEDADHYIKKTNIGKSVSTKSKQKPDYSLVTDMGIPSENNLKDISIQKKSSDINNENAAIIINNNSTTHAFKNINEQTTIKTQKNKGSLKFLSRENISTLKKDKEYINCDLIKNDNLSYSNIKKIEKNRSLNITDPTHYSKITSDNLTKSNINDGEVTYLLNSTAAKNLKYMQEAPYESDITKTVKASPKAVSRNTPQLEQKGDTFFYNNKRENVYTNTNILKNNFLGDKNNKDSLIINDLVTKRFEGVIDQFRQKSLRRKQIKKYQSLFDSQEKMALRQTLERPNNLNVKNTYHNRSSFHCEAKTPDSGLDTTDYSNCKSNSSLKTSDETLKYSPTAFLKEALGDEYMNAMSDSQQEITEIRHCSTPIQVSNKQYRTFRTEKSIGSSDISMLISTIDSLYSTVDKNRNKRSSVLKQAAVVRPLFSSRVSSNTCVYESLEEFKTNPKFEELKREMFVQSAIIVQVSKALNFCRQSPTFFGSISHLEAEKYFLFATQKKKIIEKELNRDYEEMESEQCCGIINVENLVFSTNLQNKTETNNIKQYYLCVIHAGAMLFVSDIVFPAKNGGIVFKKSFQFNDMASDFEIYVKLYSMKLDKSANKQKLFSPPTKIYSTRKSEKANINNNIEASSFQLLGVSKVVISDLYKDNTFTFQKMLPNAGICDTFTADIHSSIKVNTNISGFLTIGTSNILWNRRWCVLEGTLLKYWNYPNDETVKEPVEIINLSESANHHVTSADKIVCSRPRTLTLRVMSERGDLKEYFLQTDNTLEFEEWKRQLNSVLISLSNWNCLRNLTT